MLMPAVLRRRKVRRSKIAGSTMTLLWSATRRQHRMRLDGQSRPKTINGQLCRHRFPAGLGNRTLLKNTFSSGPLPSPLATRPVPIPPPAPARHLAHFLLTSPPLPPLPGTLPAAQRMMRATGQPITIRLDGGLRL